MNRIKDNKVLYFLIQFMANTVFAMIIWPLLDLFFCSVIYKKQFVYSVHEHIIGPIIYGIIFTIVFIVPKEISNKKNKSLKK